MKKCLVLLLGALSLCVDGYCLTYSSALTEVRHFIKDDATSANLQRYTDTFLGIYVEEAQREVVNETWCLQKSTDIVLSASTTFYSLPTDLLAVKLVRFRDSTNRMRNLYETSYKATRENNPDVERQTGPPMQYSLRYSTFGAVAYQIFPIPVATTSSTGTMTVDYYKTETALSASSDSLLDGVSLLIPYHEVVVFGAVARIKLIEGDTTGAATFLQMYTSALQAMNSRLGERPNLNPGFSGASPGSSSSIGR